MRLYIGALSKDGGDLPWAAARSSLRKSHRLFLRALRTPDKLGMTQEVTGFHVRKMF